MNLAAPEVARTAQNGRVHRQAGFTLVELMMAIGIIALLAAIALPSYQRYIERAHLATVLVDIDALRIKSQVISQESGRDLCNWNYRSSTVGVHNEASRQLDSLIKETRAALDPRRWDLRFVRPGSLVDGSPFTLQFGAQGDAAQLARTRLLAEELQRDGLFAQWKRNTAAAAIFTVYLGPCSASAAGAAPAPLTTTGTTTTPTPPSIPPGTLPVVAPAASVPVAPPQPIQQVPDRIPAQVPAVAPALIPPSTGTGSTGSTGGAGTVAPPSATGLPGTSSSSQSAPAQTPAQTAAQCHTQCRVIHPNGNSRAYRSCIQQCGSN